ncbi:MAG: GNAT family N-acetyltransferase [Gammaproteobacteria bacterium]|nr:GNAT family N-acetyltransferase [Gammaproteobacteria bacterium]
MDIPQIRAATELEVEATVQALVLGFGSDPVTRWIWPEPLEYVQGMAAFARAYGGKAFAQQSAYVCDGFAGAALWLPPGVHPDEAELEAVVGNRMDPTRRQDVVRALERLEEYHPTEPCWTLPLIAVDVAHQGQGLGGLLMKHALRRCDADGTPAYLESSNPQNITLYARHGFEVVGEVREGDCPVFTPMVRPAS